VIICGDALVELRKLTDESVNCCVTSPPYWGLRDYGVPGQLGLEKTPEEYVARMVEVFREVRRVLRSDGVFWLNLGDTYSAQRWTGTGKGQPMNKYRDGQRDINPEKATGLPDKNLVGIPWRVAFALQADGWWLRQDIIWAKPNPMPESVRDRCTKAHEYIFMLTKSARYWYGAEAVKEPVCEVSLKRAEYGWDCDRPSTKNNALGDKAGIHTEKMGTRFVNPEGRNLRSVWTITTKPYAEAHFATFPPEIPERCIKAGCPKGGKVLDPFFGAGTTGLVAMRLGREFIGIELNPAYCEMAKKRIYGTLHVELAQEAT
jgi:DNA modification methylase